MLNKRGYAIADGLWRLAILRALASTEDGVNKTELASAVKLTEGDAEQQELERHLHQLSSQQLVEVKFQDSAEVLRPTPLVRQILKSLFSRSRSDRGGWL